MDNEDLFRILAGNKAIKPELKKELEHMIKREVYSKSQIILSPGHVSNRVWFIEKGAAMAYVYKEDRKVPFWFWNHHEIVMNIHSFFKQVPSDSYIELLEPSILLSISHEHVQQMVAKFPECSGYIQSLLEDYSKKSQDRILRLACSAEDHYLSLMKESPFVFMKASVESIAAFLGISRKTLNRIRYKHLRD
ncbi:Crp/Fnr family transcriptional regulator [Pedobacter sp. AW31-3R]|uniref:Crp/Fnr family transcriptional regulator n=1 Tax=Pedobacter sp. AW31-3R TaxID=3445781 RepID=UPI003F9F42A9